MDSNDYLDKVIAAIVGITCLIVLGFGVSEIARRWYIYSWFFGVALCALCLWFILMLYQKMHRFYAETQIMLADSNLTFKRSEKQVSSLSYNREEESAELPDDWQKPKIYGVGEWSDNNAHQQIADDFED